MNKDELLDAIEQYRNSDMDRAILLDGAWGSGKTYFVRNYLESKSKYIYLSAFGLKNSSEIDKAILAGIPKKAFKNKGKGNLHLKIPDFAKDVLKQISINGLKLPDSLFDESAIVNASAKILKEYLIIIDDIERSTISLSNLLGKISIYTEQYNFKILLVANTKKIPKDDAAVFEEYMDKIIRENLSFQQDYQSIISSLIENTNSGAKELLQKNTQSILNFIDGYNITNIRKIQSGIEKATEVIKIIQAKFRYKNDEEYERLITDIILFFIYNETGFGKTTIDPHQSIQSICLPPDKYDEPNSIRYFEFIAAYGVLEIRTNSKNIQEVLERHVKTLIDSREIKGDPTMTLYGDTYRVEDNEIITLEQDIIDKLESGNYTYKFYPRILLVLIRCKNIMDDSSFLDKAKKYIFSHLDNIDDKDFDFIDLATFTFYGQEEMGEYQSEVNKLRNEIRNLKEKKAFLLINSVIKEDNWSEKLRSAVYENEEEIVSRKQFFSILDTNTITAKLEHKDVKTIDFCNVRDAITGIYHRIKEQPDLFCELDYDALVEFHNKFIKLEPKTHTSKQVFEYIKKDLESYIDSFNMICNIK